MKTEFKLELPPGPIMLDVALLAPGAGLGGPVYISYVHKANVVIHCPAYAVWGAGVIKPRTTKAQVIVCTLAVDKDGAVWAFPYWQMNTGRKWKEVKREASIQALDGAATLPDWVRCYG